MKPANSTMESTLVGNVGCASGFEKRIMQEQSGRVNATSKVRCEHFDSVLNSSLLLWQGRWGPFKVHQQGNRGTVCNMKPMDKNQGDSKRNKSNLGQDRAETSCQRDVPTSETVQDKRRRKPRQKVIKKGQPDCKASREVAKATRGI
ncbi:hypothetical protein J1N35_022577 [Gossypium stocksii]|uniref:Uncharacterized protein n=1 Tax=Gossypium stocksii TaxID=47602 RepID=A0A9D3VHF9_9ROSI|nr:hypothetical protein J1N35_022577 [Gossypium stocksii]